MRNLFFSVALIGGIVAVSAAHGETASVRRAEVQAAFDAADRGQLTLADVARLQSHPLSGWLEVLVRERELRHISRETLGGLLEDLGPQPAATRLRQAWLRRAAAEGRWSDFLAHDRPGGDVTLQCFTLQAKLATNAVDAAWVQAATGLWLSADSQPTACDPVFTALAQRGDLTPALRWQRIELAARAGNTGLMRAAARNLPEAELALIRDYAAFIDAPHARAAQWPKDARSRAMAEIGLARLARRDPGAAERALASNASLLPAGSREHGAVRAAIALWTAASYGAESARRLAAVPDAAFDEALHGWAVREALARGDRAGALKAIERMPAALRGTAQWQYFEARLREDLGDAAAAAPLFAAAAKSPTFHGFLAADRAGTPYALCPRDPSDDRRIGRDVERNAALARAIELFRIKRPALAALEWQAAVERMDDTRRVLAVQKAMQARWYDRALFGMPANPQALQYYTLRFPLHHETLIRRESRKNGLEPSLVAALTRAESAFMPEARSPANARGLMQLLPSTAEGVSRRLGLPWQGADSLFRPELNVPLGTAYLAQRIGDNGGLAYRAIAAYNAGQGAVQRWMAARPSLPADYWIETIPFKETREYVPRVLAFSVIYDWRLDGRTRSLTDRLEGSDEHVPRQFACTTVPDAAASTATPTAR
ncbi:lytic transglycosylase domain-containing protein [Silanimonas sp.]|uniref:lytic transglycosylase domain-containing protein n=1 Tax=Silanimonas sp. TaxID=1929290 RepID=UPI0022C1EBAC|nr:lytic transglycosylase domain-containing protein [Silanimonas sp.]MCZ8115815.1 transglycosylase SLT domain-containing protein [Silanimonas sp.]